jgi:hypothetical protein
MQVLRKLTTVSVIVGPVLDFSGLPVTDAILSDFNLNENGSTSTLGLPSSSSHSHNGHYLILLDGSHVSAEGRLEITSNNPDHAMPPARFQVVSQAVYDVMYGDDAVGPIPADSLSVAPPIYGEVQTNNSCGFNLFSFYKETKRHSIALLDSNKDPYDLTGLTLTVYVESSNKVTLEVIENDDITVSGNIVSFDTQLSNEVNGQHIWSLRTYPDNAVLAQGTYNVRRAAF